MFSDYSESSSDRVRSLASLPEGAQGVVVEVAGQSDLRAGRLLSL